MEHVTSDLKLIDRPTVWTGSVRKAATSSPSTATKRSMGTVTPTTTDTSSAVKSKTTIRPCRNWKPTNSTRTPWNPTQGSGEPCLTLNNCYPTCADWKTN